MYATTTAAWRGAGLKASLACAVCLWLPAALAQPPGGGPGGTAQSGRAGALFDITGQWVAVVNEDWRWRMITAPVGDVSSIPVNGRGRAEAAAWDLEADRAAGDLCKAFGAPGLIRQPGRIRIDWEDDDTLRLDFDAGEQTRRLEFGAPRPSGSPSLQGDSRASWDRQTLQRGVFGSSAPPSGALYVETTSLAPGYLRPNGVPYSAEATMKEYFHTFSLPDDGGAWLIVTTVVNDPVYLSSDLVISTQFRKEDDRAGFSPRPCDIQPPLVEREPAPPGPFG
jgi:hypothetical protein